MSQPNQPEMGTRRFGAVNWLGLYTLISRETRRFMAVWTQTVLAPLVTAGLFVLIFTLAVGSARGDVMGVSFMHFLAPGILMMTVIQNAFANVSSSIVISKVQGNIVDTLMPPLSGAELVIGYLVGGVMRGLLVALSIVLVIFPVLGLGVAHPLWALLYIVLGGAFLGGLGLIAGVYANKFDQMAAITNFVITPLAFLSGTFYSVQTTPPLMQKISHVNPVFYLIDGMRYAVLGVSDRTPTLGLLVIGPSLVVVVAIAGWMMKTGYRLKA